SPAQTRPATDESLRAQLDRLGGTPYRLRNVTAALDGRPLVPSSLLNALRRALVEQLDAAAARGRARTMAADPVLPTLRAPLEARSEHGAPDPVLSVLCRSTGQLEATLSAGIRTIYLEYQDIQGYEPAVALARAAGATV